MSQQPVVSATAFLFIFLGTLVYFLIRVWAGHWPVLRQIRAFESIKGLTSRAVETGRGLHLSLGIGGVADDSTADSLAGLAILNYLAEQAAITGVAPIVSMANPALMLYTQNMTQAVHLNDSRSAEDSYRNVRWIAPQPAAYAAGVMNLMNIDKTEANVMVGKFGDEYLLIGETAARLRTGHIGGTSDPNTLPFIYASAEETLLGEEIYAAGAYLQQHPAHVASLTTQDSMRLLIVLFIFTGIILASVS